MDVEIVPWPGEDDGTRPRLLVVDDESPPPHSTDCLEDWVRASTPRADVEARVAALLARAETHRPEPPRLDEWGVLQFGGRSVVVPPIEARLARVLIERFGRVVGHDRLVSAAWPDGIGTRNTLDVRILRLRRRLASLGLSIRTVRARGYLLERSEPAASSVSDLA
jgi:DNA-binding response OmpR family regulator